MTPEYRRKNLRAELAATGVPADDITHRLLGHDDWRGEADLDCLLAVETIVVLRDQVDAFRTIIEAIEAENERLREAATLALRQVEEIGTQLRIVRDMLPEEVTDV